MKPKVVPIDNRTFAIQGVPQEVVVRSDVVTSRDNPCMVVSVFVGGREISTGSIEVDLQNGVVVGQFKPPSPTYRDDKPEVAFIHQLWEGE